MIISTELEKTFDKIQYQFIAALFTIAKNWKQLKCLTTDEWIQTVVYPYNETNIQLSNRNNELLRHTT